MKIYISADMEGVNGVVLKEHVDPAAREYQPARQWMTAEVNAAIAGAVAAGATEVVVNDSHSNMANLLVDQLHPKAQLVSGPGKPFSMVQDLDDSCAGAFFTGYHASFGTPQAIHDHIYAYSLIESIHVNGQQVGELGLNAGMAGAYGVPTLLVTGDKALAGEARALMPWVRAVAVKEGRGRLCARCYPFQETLKAIREEAEQAVRNRKKAKALIFKAPLVLEVRFPKVEMADAAALLPGAERIETKVLRYETAAYPELYRAFLALFRLARSVF